MGLKTMFGAAALVACSATTALAMSFEVPKDADECVGQMISLEAYDIATSGGGILDIDKDEFSAIIERCEQETGTEVIRYDGYQHLTIAIPKF